jgi:hypothetical protein
MMLKIYRVFASFIFIGIVSLVVLYTIYERSFKLTAIERPRSTKQNTETIEFKNEITIVTIGDYESRQTVLDWISSLEKNLYKDYKVLSFDQPLVDFLISNGTKSDKIAKIPNEWIVPNELKSNVWYQLILMGTNFVYSDPSVAWMSPHVLDHLSHQYVNSVADFLFPIDMPAAFFYTRVTQFTKDLFSRVVDLQTKSQVTDEEALENVLSQISLNDFRLDTLDLLLYASYSVHFEQRLNEKTNIKPLITNTRKSKEETPTKIDKSTYKKDFSSDTFNKNFALNARDEARISQIMNHNKIDNINIISISNYGFRNFTLNWIISLKRHGYSKFVVFSFDQKLIDLLSQKGYRKQVVLIPREWIDYPISSDMQSYMRGDYVNIVKSKINVVYNLLIRKHAVIHSDTDVVWLNGHVIDHIKLQYENSFAEALFSQDTNGRDRIHNTGFYFASPTDSVIRLLQRLILTQRSDLGGNDQTIFNALLRQSAFNDSRVDTLDAVLYMDGRDHFKVKINQKVGVDSIIAHATYTNGPDEKVDMFKSKGYWYSDEF